MPRLHRCAPCLVASFLVVLFATAAPAEAGRIEAVRGKRYTLTKRHGPWTIMVASFSDVPNEKIVVEGGRARRVRNEDKRPGKSAIEAADELVYELRQYGIPAYVYVQDAELDRVTTIARSPTIEADGGQRLRQRTYKARKRNVAVLAGNYRSTNDETAQKTLALVKRFRPGFLTGGGNDGFTTHSATGAIFRPTPGQPDPLAGAFLTMNPLITPEEAREMAGQRDPLLLRLNSGAEHSLLKCKGKYTVVVATFQGDKAPVAKFNENFDGNLMSSQATDSLDKAGASAWQMARYMRQRGTEAYVLHERYQSIVTVGAFDSPNDPRIAKVVRFFSPKPVRDPATGATKLRYEFLRIPLGANPKKDGEIILPIDANPKVISVPRL